MLRTVYLSRDDGSHYQSVIERNLSLTWDRLQDRTALFSALETVISQPFDLTSSMSIRVQGYLVGDEKYLAIVWHHIGFDGWSADLFVQQLAEAYSALSLNKELAFEEADISYIDYALWQKHYLKDEVLEALESYWKQQLGGYETL